MFARVGRAGLSAIKDRQYDHGAALSGELCTSFEILSDLFRLQPRREYYLMQSTFKRLLVASDAAYESGVGSAGFLAVLHPGRTDEIRVGISINIPAEAYVLWGDRKTYIAQLELFAVYVVMLQIPSLIRGSHGLWCIDNIAALMALVNGTSGIRSLDQMAKAVHLGAFALQAQAYYEYVESKANWSDEISRLGLRGPWARKEGFLLYTCQATTLLLELPCFAIVTVFSYLGA